MKIHRGAPNVGEYFNRKSFINYEDCGKSYDKMIKKIIELDKDDKKYKEFLKEAWMTKQNEENVDKKIEDLEKFLETVASA